MDSPHRPFRAAWGCLWLLGALACERTVDGIEQDTRAVTARAREGADEAKQKLESEVGAFKTEADAKLQQLSVSIESLKAKAQTDVTGSRQKLEEQLQETRDKLARLRAGTSAEWQQTKQDLDQRIAELGRRLNETLDHAGGSLDKAGDKVEHALSPGSAPPSQPAPP